MYKMDDKIRKPLEIYINEVLKVAYPNMKCEIKEIIGIETFKVGRTCENKAYIDTEIIIFKDGLTEIVYPEGCSLACILKEITIAVSRLYDENRELINADENYLFVKNYNKKVEKTGICYDRICEIATKAIDGLFEDDMESAYEYCENEMELTEKEKRYFGIEKIDE